MSLALPVSLPLLMKLQSEPLLVWWAPGARGPPTWQPAFAAPGSGRLGLPARARPARPAWHSPRRVFLALVEEVEDRWHCGCSGRGQGKLAQTPSGIGH